MKPPDVALRELVLQWLDKAAADFDAVERHNSTMNVWVPVSA
jgi:hypothetical protein